MRKFTRRIAAIPLALAALGVGSISDPAPAAATELFTVCPSGNSGVVTADTSCPFADAVRASYYTQPGTTVFAYSPVTGKFYTMQCRLTVTDMWWPYPKRCFGINDSGVPLVVYIR